MLTIRGNLQITANDLLNGIEQLGNSDLEDFIHRILLIKAKRYAPKVDELELDLLSKINKGLDNAIYQRLDALTAKRKSETISKEEYKELLDLVEIIENENVERLRYLGQLAQLKNISVRTLMKQLDIKPRGYEKDLH